MTTPLRSHDARRWVLWILIATLWWSLDGFTDVMNYRVMQPAASPGSSMPMERIWRAYMLSAWLWIPLTALALWLAERFPVGPGVWRRHLLWQSAGAVGACVARAAAVVALNPAGGWYVRVPPFPEVLVTSFANNFFTFCMLVGVGHALVYGRRIRERDEQLARAELHALKMQLHPHFLFNALNTINSYVRADPGVAQRMIARLSDLLRHVLESERVQEVPLKEELRIVGAYLDIEKLRFEDRLRVDWQVDTVALEGAVPHLLLQPLVENAIRHGIAPRSIPGTLSIVASRVEDSLRIVIRDDGVGARTGNGAPRGRGLSITASRLRQLYGERQSLTVTTPPAGGFQVIISFPYRTLES